MTAPHRTHRADGNQEPIVSGLRQLGATVQILSQVGEGCPDIAVGWHGRNYFFEIKMPGGKREPKQVIWHNEWGGQVDTIESLDGAIAILNRETTR